MEEEEEETSGTRVEMDATKHIQRAGMTGADLYEKGLMYESMGNRRSALICFLCCLADAKGEAPRLSPNLPNCLHKIATLYYEDGQYEQALKFIQAERFLYETALVSDVGGLSTVPEGEEESGEEGDGPAGALPADSASRTPTPAPPHGARLRRQFSAGLEGKAEVFEELSHLFFEEKKHDIAMEYAFKALKIRQALVERDTPQVPPATLQHFGRVYAELGRQKYADAFERYRERTASDTTPTPSLGRGLSVPDLRNVIREVSEGQESGPGDGNPASPAFRRRSTMPTMPATPNPSTVTTAATSSPSPAASDEKKETPAKKRSPTRVFVVGVTILLFLLLFWRFVASSPTSILSAL